jgi:ABC-type Fe3+ transport system permease subunit
MEVMVNWWAVILATLSSMIVGSIWYARPVFGKAWMKLAGISDKDMQKKSNVATPIIITLVVSFLTAYILAHVTFLANHFFHNSFLQDALSTAFWLWLGFTAARVITHDVFEGRPWRLTFMTITHELVTIVVMALIIGLMQP